MKLCNNWKYDIQIGEYSCVSDKVVLSPDVSHNNTISLALGQNRFGGQIIIMNDYCRLS